MKRLLLGAALLVTRSLLAHDFWIEPSAFRPAPGEIVTARLRVGQKLRGEAVPRIPPLVARFLLRGERGQTPLIGRLGSDPAGAVRISERGLQWIGYESNAALVTLEAAKFEDYLREEGLERIVAQRAKSGQSGSEGRERFHRCAKALLASGESSKGFEIPLGFTLEIVLRENPYAKRAGDALPLLLLFRGKPLAGALVVAMNRDDPEHAIRVRTDARGRAALRLPRAGFWLLKSVHMERTTSGDADWESWWASVTFDNGSTISAKGGESAK